MRGGTGSSGLRSRHTTRGRATRRANLRLPRLRRLSSTARLDRRRLPAISRPGSSIRRGEARREDAGHPPSLAAPPPDLAPGTASLILLLASAIPNRILAGWARERDLRRVRAGLVLMSAIGFLPLLIRFYFEFHAFHILWHGNAYGSVVWLILGLHTAHIMTDLGDTLVLTALIFTRRGAAARGIWLRPMSSSRAE